MTEKEIPVRIARATAERFGAEITANPDQAGADSLARMLEHCSHRRYSDRPVTPELLRLLFACAFSAPSKSDLQQADIVQVADPATRTTIADLVADNPWVRTAPVFLIFCGNNRRTRQVAELRGKPFANDHLDAFMNSAVDAGIVLASFIHAAEAAGLGCCPISSVRNHSQKVSDLLELPEWVFPLAGLCVGYPAEPGMVTSRLGLDITVHTDRFDESNIADKITAYDRRRLARQQYKKQRDVARFGMAELYGWSEDKARQYAKPERADFGAFIRGKKFNLG
ncbi:MAG: NADPH-dependent oxidoreductase [Betaproteobacteria bacterium]|nr:NADPH-dependent oxidoreductase [Betaproteobacteria bacterium]